MLRNNVLWVEDIAGGVLQMGKTDIFGCPVYLMILFGFRIKVFDVNPQRIATRRKLGDDSNRKKYLP